MKFMVGNQISDLIKEGPEEGIIAFNESHLSIPFKNMAVRNI